MRVFLSSKKVIVAGIDISKKVLHIAKGRIGQDADLREEIPDIILEVPTSDVVTFTDPFTTTPIPGVNKRMNVLNHLELT